MGRQYYVYIMTNKNNTVLYTGITNDLKRRVYEHKEKLVKGFTNKVVSRIFRTFIDDLNLVSPVTLHLIPMPVLQVDPSLNIASAPISSLLCTEAVQLQASVQNYHQESNQLPWSFSGSPS